MFSDRTADIQQRIERALTQRQNNRITEINLNSLKTYYHYITHQYETVLIEYANDEDSMNDLQEKLSKYIEKMKIEYEFISIEKHNLMQQLESIQHQRQAKIIKNASLAEQIKILQEIQKNCSQKQKELLKAKSDLKEEKQEIEKENDAQDCRIIEISSSLNDKKSQVAYKLHYNENLLRYSENIEEKIHINEQYSSKVRNEIQRCDHQLKINSDQIDLVLKYQSKLIDHFESLQKKQLHYHQLIQQAKNDLKVQMNHKNILQEFQEELNFQKDERDKELLIQQKEISALERKIMQQQLERQQNITNLQKLEEYLYNLKQQNKNIEQAIEKQLAQDFLIKQVMNRKFTQKYASKFKELPILQQKSFNLSQNKADIDQKSGSTAGSQQGFAFTPMR